MLIIGFITSNFSRCSVPVQNLEQFLLIYKYFSTGISLCHVTMFISYKKELLSICIIGSFTEAPFNRYSLLIYLMNHKFIFHLLLKFLKFSVALEIDTHMSTSYLDFLIRIFQKYYLNYFHPFLCPSHWLQYLQHLLQGYLRSLLWLSR